MESVNLPSWIRIWCLYQAIEINDGQAHWATDPLWSIDSYWFESFVCKASESKLYYLKNESVLQIFRETHGASP